MAKNKPQHTIDNGMLSNSRNWTDFVSKESLLLYPGKDENRQRLIYTLLTWAEKPTSLEVMQFCIEYKIPYTSLRELDNKYEDVHEAYVFAKQMIACHRRVGSMNKRLDGNYAYRDMHLYDPEWHAINKYHSDMKKDEDKQSHTFNVNLGKPAVGTKEDLTRKIEEQL